MSKLKALLFDVDGTIADTERDGHRVAFNQAFADTGLDWDWGGATFVDVAFLRHIFAKQSGNLMHY